MKQNRTRRIVPDNAAPSLSNVRKPRTSLCRAVNHGFKQMHERWGRLAYETSYSISGQNRYCRLFAPACYRPPLDAPEGYRYFAGLLKLAFNMHDDGSTVSPNAPRTTIEAGYTYFGQFVDHDLTNDKSVRTDPWKFEPEELLNSRSPYLDLSHIYGNGPWDPEDCRLYDGVRFKVGVGARCEKEAEGPTLGEFDVAMDADCKPLLADSRAGDNVILRQMTALFCHLHNLAVEQFERDYEHDPRRLFQRARQHTTWQFQRLVCEDYLSHVLNQRHLRGSFPGPPSLHTVGWFFNSGRILCCCDAFWAQHAAELIFPGPG